MCTRQQCQFPKPEFEGNEDKMQRIRAFFPTVDYLLKTKLKIVLLKTMCTQFFSLALFPCRVQTQHYWKSLRSQPFCLCLRHCTANTLCGCGEIFISYVHSCPFAVLGERQLTTNPSSVYPCADIFMYLCWSMFQPEWMKQQDSLEAYKAHRWYTSKWTSLYRVTCHSSCFFSKCHIYVPYVQRKWITSYRLLSFMLTERQRHILRIWLVFFV